MKTEKEFLLDELREHTSDCDYARHQHYFEQKKYDKQSEVFNTVQAVVFLTTIAMYVLIVSGVYENTALTILGLVLSVASTLIEILSYMLNYDEKANQHWKAAQMYSELYRKCQFFCSDYANQSTEVWREKLRDISEELSRLALMSPTLSEESLLKGCMHLLEKRYPVHRAILNEKMTELDEVVFAIKNVFDDSKIEIYVFGSYVNSMYHNDIDIAVVVHVIDVPMEKEEALVDIERKYLLRGLKLDLTIITERDLIANRCTAFIKNICSGICYYKSLDIKKTLQDYEQALFNYPDMVQYFTDKATEYYNVSFKDYVQNAFYAYYHGLTAVLNAYNINWYGEKSLLDQCDLLVSKKTSFEDISVEKEKLEQLIQHARLYLNQKEKVFLNDGLICGDAISSLHAYFSKDIDTLKTIAETTSKNISSVA